VSNIPRMGIVSLATHGRYGQGLARLQDSVRAVGFAGEFIPWPPGTYPARCPPHLDVPFAFKPFCLAEARQSGLELILWLDALCVSVRALDPLFEQIDRRGYLLFRSRGRRLGQWASDEALARFDLSRDEAMSIPEVNAAALGLDVRSSVAREFLERWHEEARQSVAFRGVREAVQTGTHRSDIKWNRGRRASADPRVRGHRHDQTVAGILAHRLGMALTPVGLQPYSPGRGWIRRDSVLVVERSGRLTGAELATLARAGSLRYLRHLLLWPFRRER
jgi:hypothetical protein